MKKSTADHMHRKRRKNNLVWLFALLGILVLFLGTILAFLIFSNLSSKPTETVQEVSEVYAYVAPKLFGGADAKSPVAGMGVDHPDDAYCLVSQRVQQVGEDILIAGELKNK